MALKRKIKKFFKIAVFLGALGVFIGTIIFAYFVITLSYELPSDEQIVNRQVEESTKIYDRTNQVILYEVGGDKKRTVISLSEIPQSLKDATISIEDERFYSEPAFDWRGILRAVWVNVTRGTIAQGGSTITQQLVKKAFLSDEQKITRKIKELILAIKINKFYSKDRILELYLNEIPYGPTIYGVESASQSYFGKSAKDLTLPESAILAAIPKAPTFYSPWGTHTKELITRQRTILKKMRELNKIDENDYQKALSTQITFTQRSSGVKAPHFVFMVLDELANQSDKYGDDVLRKGGLRITTTLDWDLQQIAEKAIADGASRNEKLYNGKNAALVAQDPKTGQILSLVGSRDYFDTKNSGNFNVASQGLRQPGSALKPFVYMTAFEKGYNPNSIVFDVPTEFSANDPNCPAIVDFNNENTACFHPQNYDEKFRGPVTLKSALAESLNIPAVKVLYLAGLKDVIEKAQLYGLKTLNDPNQYGLSLVLGGGAIHLTDLVEAYSVLAQEGVKHNQSVILEIKDNKGVTLDSFQDKSENVINAQYPRLINQILKDENLRANLFQNSLNLTTIPGYEIALKTGTSNDYRDAWTFGYTPFLVTGIWAGNNDNTPMQRRGSSILAAVPIWNSFMVEAVKKYKPEKFNDPDPVTASKPMLDGNYLVNGNIHSILYYVDKNDPTGPVPQNPQNDPQFINWETGVNGWIGTNKSSLLNSFIQQLQGIQNQLFSSSTTSTIR